jgi:8-oxo-dGTP pyrophosphatase MutT (NUDIX family)
MHKAPIPFNMPPASHLDLINACDSFPYPTTDLYDQHISTYYHLRIASLPSETLGFLLPSVALTFSNLPDWSVDSDTSPRTVTLTTGSNEPERSLAVAKTTAAMKATGHWKVLDKWRGELYPIYGPSGDLLFTVERSASPLFGVVTYGVHMTAYFYASPEAREELKIWVPRRSGTKQTYPSMLDNTVAGGIAAGEMPFDCMVRESMEEASLPEELVRRRARAVGCVTYFHVRDERAGGETGLLQPECQYVYDLDLTGEVGVECKPNDDEVEGFEVMDVPQVLDSLAKEEFKPNCAFVMIDFLIRHGIITKENEKDYAEICARLHRRLEFPMG